MTENVMEYMDKHQVEAYLKEKNIYPPEAVLEVRDLHNVKESIDGFVNMIYHIADGTGKSVVLKQIVHFPRFRAVDEAKYGDNAEYTNFVLDLSRMRTEIAVLIFWNAIDPGICPEIYLFDEENSVIVMEDLVDLALLRYDNCRMVAHENIGRVMGDFFGRNLFYSSDLNLTDYKRRELEKNFTSSEYASIGQHIFDTNVAVSPERDMAPGVEATRAAVLANPAVQKEFARARENFLHQKECLIHADLHASNVMVGGGQTKIIDTEFAGFGPSGQDIGRFCASFVLNYFSWEEDDNYSAAQISAWRDYVLDVIETVLTKTIETLGILWEEHRDESYKLRHTDFDEYVRYHIKDWISYTVINAASRLSWRGMCYDFARLPEDRRAYPSALILKLVEDVLPNLDDYTDVPAFIAKLKRHVGEHPRRECL